MEDDVAALGGQVHTVGVTNIASKYFDLLERLSREGIEPTPGVESIIIDEGSDLAAFREESFDEVTSNETIRAGDQHSFIVELQARYPSVFGVEYIR